MLQFQMLAAFIVQSLAANCDPHLLAGVCRAHAAGQPLGHGVWPAKVEVICISMSLLIAHSEYHKHHRFCFESDTIQQAHRGTQWSDFLQQGRCQTLRALTGMHHAGVPCVVSIHPLCRHSMLDLNDSAQQQHIAHWVTTAKCVRTCSICDSSLCPASNSR